jgi:DNA-binding HxlR family transcriptional regulator
MSFARSRDLRLPTPEEAPPGRSALAYEVPEKHTVLGTALQGPYPEGFEAADFALGCFWGAERRFWQLPAGVWTTLTGFQGGYTPYPVDDEIRTGLTGHAETVRVVFDPAEITYERLLQLFWESHGASRDILTARLRKLEAAGAVRREQYNEHPPRYEYHLTPAGQELGDVLLTLMKWGDRHLNSDDPPLKWQHSCGETLEPKLICAHCGEPARKGVHSPTGRGALPAG